MAAGDSGRVAGLDPTFLTHFEAMRAAALARHGIRVTVVAGFRTHDEQWRLWRLYLSGQGNLAAYPGTSNHEARPPAGTGFAIDMAPNVDVEPRLVPLLAEFGLCLPVKPPRSRQWEPWHVEPCWIQPRTSPEYRPRPPLGPTPPPAAQEDDDMPLNDADKAWIRQAISADNEAWAKHVMNHINGTGDSIVKRLADGFLVALGNAVKLIKG